MIELKHTKEMGTVNERLSRLERDAMYAKEVIERFVPRDATGKILSYTRYPTSSHPIETHPEPSLSD